MNIVEVDVLVEEVEGKYRDKRDKVPRASTSMILRSIVESKDGSSLTKKLTDGNVEKKVVM